MSVNSYSGLTILNKSIKFTDIFNNQFESTHSNTKTKKIKEVSDKNNKSKKEQRVGIKKVKLNKKWNIKSKDRKV